jgi:hypothetical protein
VLIVARWLESKNLLKNNMYLGLYPEHLYLFSHVLINFFFLAKVICIPKLELFWVINNCDKMLRSGCYFIECTLNSIRKSEPWKSLKQVINHTFGKLAHFLKAQKIIF